MKLDAAGRRTYLYPHRAIKEAFRREIQSLANSVQPGVLVDVGCGLRPYETLFHSVRYIGLDVVDSGRPHEMKQPDVYFDGANLPFDSASVDHVLCTQVLQFAANPPFMFQEFARVLRDGGNLILSAPQSEPATERPYDRYRFTRDGLEALCAENGFRVVTIRPVIGYWQSLAYDLNCFAARTLHHRGLVGKAVLVVIGCVTQSSAAVLDRTTSYTGNINAWVVHAVLENRKEDTGGQK